MPLTKGGRDMEFDDFLKASDETLENYLKPNKKDSDSKKAKTSAPSWWHGDSNDDDDDDNDDDDKRSEDNFGIGTGKSFIKKKLPEKNDKEAVRIPLAAASIDDESDNSAASSADEDPNVKSSCIDLVTSYDNQGGHAQSPTYTADDNDSDADGGQGALTRVSSASFHTTQFTSAARRTSMTADVTSFDLAAEDTQVNHQLRLDTNHQPQFDLQLKGDGANNDSLQREMGQLDDSVKGKPTMLSKVSLLSSMDDTTAMPGLNLEKTMQKTVNDVTAIDTDGRNDYSAIRSMVAKELMNNTASLWQQESNDFNSDLISQERNNQQIPKLQERDQLTTKPRHKVVSSVTGTQSFGMKPVKDNRFNESIDNETMHIIDTLDSAVMAGDYEESYISASPTPTPRHKKHLDSNPEGQSPQRNNQTSTVNRKGQEVGSLNQNISKMSPRLQPTVGNTQNQLKVNRRRYAHVASSGYGKGTNTSKPTSTGQDKQISGKNLKNKGMSSTFTKLPLDPSVIHKMADNLLYQDASISQQAATRKAGLIPSTKRKSISFSDENIDFRPKERNEELFKESLHFAKESIEWQNQWRTERKEAAQTKAESLLKEREMNSQMEALRLEYEQKIKQLLMEVDKWKKLQPERQMTSVFSKFLTENMPKGVTKEQLENIEQEIKEQETILCGYQKENERLYTEIKILQQSSKERENHLMAENQRLQHECTNLRLELNQKELEIRSRNMLIPSPMITRNNPSTNAHDNDKEEIRHLLNEKDLVQQKFRDLELTKQRIENTLDKSQNDLRNLQKQFETEKEINRIEMEKLREKHLDEVDDLKRKLRWYVDNQVMLEKDSQKLKAKDQEIAELMRLLSQGGNVTKQSSNFNKEVPNKTANNKSSSSLISFLESRIVSLEKELQDKQEDGDRSLRTLQQQFYAMKTQYEEHISALEHDLEQMMQHLSSGNKDGGDTTKGGQTAIILRKTLNETRKQLEKKEQIISDLKQTFTSTAAVQPSKEKTFQQAGGSDKLEELRKLVRNKDQIILQLQNQIKNLEVNQQQQANDATLTLGKEKFPIANEYEEQHLSAALIEENERLKTYIGQLESQKGSASQNDLLQREIVKAKIMECDTDKKRALQLQQVKFEDEIKKIHLQYSQQHSTSKVAELQARVDTQEVVIRHLKEQLASNAFDSKSLAISQLAEQQAQAQVKRLQEELHQAKANFTPEMQRLDQLRAKVIALEEKEAKREKILEEYIEKRMEVTRQEAANEVAKWRRIVETKNQRWEELRRELDVILEALEEIQRRGIIVPQSLQKNAAEMREHLRVLG